MSSPRLSEPVDLRGRRIFVTGGTGFVGRCLLDYLLESAAMHGDAPLVTVLSRSPTRFLQRFSAYRNLRWLRVVQGDVTQPLDCVTDAFTDVIHGAADTHAQDDPMSWITQLVDGTRHVLEFAQRAGVERMLFISSGAVYGTQPVGVDALREDHPFAPVTTDVGATYGHGKRMAEHLCALYASQIGGVACVIARCFAIASRHIPLEGSYALGNFMRDALAGRGIEISGDGRTVRSYIAGRDMAHWLFTLLRRGAGGVAYNVGSDRPITTLELAKAVRDVVHIDQPIHVRGRQDLNARPVYLPCLDRAGSLGLSIETPLKDVLTEIACAMRTAEPLELARAINER